MVCATLRVSLTPKRSCTGSGDSPSISSPKFLAGHQSLPGFHTSVQTQQVLEQRVGVPWDLPVLTWDSLSSFSGWLLRFQKLLHPPRNTLIMLQVGGFHGN